MMMGVVFITKKIRMINNAKYQETYGNKSHVLSKVL